MSELPFEDVRAVLFDLDGTLIDSAPDLGRAADKLRTDRGMPSLPGDLYRPMAGAGARGMLSVALGMAPDHPDFSEVREEFFVNYEACLHDRTCAFEGVEALLASLVSQSLRWGVVTNKSSRFTGPIVRSMPLFATAGAIISGDTTPYSKPHPEPLLEAARRLGVQPENCVYVGDDERDIVAGVAAGMKTVAAAYGYLGRREPIAWGADAVIKTPSDLPKLLGLDSFFALQGPPRQNICRPDKSKTGAAVMAAIQRHGLDKIGLDGSEQFTS